MTYRFGERSERNLQGVHPHLVEIMRAAIAKTHIDFMVIEGLRTMDRQRVLFAKGATKTMNSRHLTGHAVDIVPYIGGAIRWDWPLYHELAKVVDAAAAKVGHPVEWGGRWRTFKDGPHWQLPFKSYPK